MNAAAELPEEAYAAALASVPDIGPATLRILLGTATPSEAWAQGSYEGDPRRIWRHHEERGIDVVMAGGPHYPHRLAGDPEAPPVLFFVGDLDALNRNPTVALVGSRSPTRYGIGVAAQFGAELAAAGVSVVSGLALGIDAAAHEGACAAGAAPVAVVAGGLDDPYPRRNARLWDRVASCGVVLSESPAGVPTQKWRFPVRNRLLAALSDIVVVVESRPNGGSMHTVRAAASRGIPVGAVPGSIRSATSAGPNSLLSDGCIPVCDVADILIALSLDGVSLPEFAWPSTSAGARSATGRGAARAPADYAGPDRDLYDLLGQDPTSLDQLARESGLDLPALCGGLERLARAGVARDLGGWWERT